MEVIVNLKILSSFKELSHTSRLWIEKCEMWTEEFFFNELQKEILLFFFFLNMKNDQNVVVIKCVLHSPRITFVLQNIKNSISYETHKVQMRVKSEYAKG